ncbi:hypothetical protein KNE206_18550 [Kitasatospora sp. NE20-6]
MNLFPCKCCGASMPRNRSNFRIRLGCRDGLSPTCMPCDRAQARARYAANPEPFKAAVAARRARQRTALGLPPSTPRERMPGDDPTSPTF